MCRSLLKTFIINEAITQVLNYANFSHLSGFPTGVANMGVGGSSKFDGVGLKSKHGGSMGGA